MFICFIDLVFSIKSVQSVYHCWPIKILKDMSVAKMLNLKDFEQYAIKNLSKMVMGYYSSGANYEHTLRDNENDFLELKIRPKFLDNDLSKINLKKKILNSLVDSPIGVAPTAMQKLSHPDGELATVKACEQQNTVFILSTISTSSIEEVAKTSPEAIKWFQLYVYKNRKLTENLIRNAEKFNFKALCLTIDAPVFGTRYADIRNNFHLPDHLRMANFDSGNLESDSIKVKKSGASGINEYVKSQFDPSLTWSVLHWIKNITRLPVILKGVLTAETAKKAIDNGADAIIVSNHGARQLDTVSSSILALPEIVSAVDKRCEIYLDGGIRCGTDAFKALALGCDAVFIGRPIVWGLSYNGCEGVKSVLEILKNELEIALMLSGCNDVNKLDKTYLTTRQAYLSKMNEFLSVD